MVISRVLEYASLKSVCLLPKQSESRYVVSSCQAPVIMWWDGKWRASITWRLELELGSGLNKTQIIELTTFWVGYMIQNEHWYFERLHLGWSSGTSCMPRFLLRCWLWVRRSEEQFRIWSSQKSDIFLSTSNYNLLVHLPLQRWD